MKDLNFTHKLFDEIIILKKCASTLSSAEKLIRNGEIKGNFLILAETQTRGKGRQDNFWFSPSGGIWLTAAFYNLNVVASITLFTGIVMHKILLESFPQIAAYLKLKWPNDLFFQDKKLGGILTKSLPAFNYHLIGIGINTNFNYFPPELENNAISLQNILQKKIENEPLITYFFDKFAEKLPLFIENGLDKNYYQQHSYLKNKQVILTTDFDVFQGKMMGIKKDGAILLKMVSGMIQPFYAGSVEKVL